MTTSPVSLFSTKSTQQWKIHTSNHSYLQFSELHSLPSRDFICFSQYVYVSKMKKIKIQRDKLILTNIWIFRYIRFNTFHSWISFYMTNCSTDMFWLFTEQINQIYILTGTARESFFLHGSITNSWTCSIRMPDLLYFKDFQDYIIKWNWISFSFFTTLFYVYIYPENPNAKWQILVNVSISTYINTYTRFNIVDASNVKGCSNNFSIRIIYLNFNLQFRNLCLRTNIYFTKPQ